MTLSDPLTLTVAALAVISIGLGKGGLAGIGVMGVPLMALVMSPVQAAAILLPILLVSDAISLWSWWQQWDRRTLALMLPGAMIGIAVGWATAALVSDAMIRILVGSIAVAFVLRWMLQGKVARATAKPHNPVAGQVWGGLAGYTSMVAHAGGPPFSVYAMPLNLDPKVLTGTSVLFFAIVNLVKVGPYLALGQFDTANLTASAILAPFVVLATLAGASLVRRMPARLYYPFAYGMVLIVGAKLIWDGAVAL